MRRMRNDALGDVLKVWLYGAATVWLGAWISPLLYNAGKALAEVSAQKTTNDFLDRLGDLCRAWEFPDFFLGGLLLAGLALFFPWMEWIHARRGVETTAGPWRVRLPDGARTGGRGQPLVRNPGGWWHAGAGFLLAAGLLLPMGMALVPAGYATLRAPEQGMVVLVLHTLLAAWALALVMEAFFRGIVMGVFLRGMRPAAALGMSAAFFALALSAVPPAGLNVADSEAPRVGFELMRLMAARFAEGAVVTGEFAPLLALGGVLAYARWMTASLWLPVGLHAGWLFARNLLIRLGGTEPAAETSFPVEVAMHGLIPLAAILAAGVLAHFLIANPRETHAAES